MRIELPLRRHDRRPSIAVVGFPCGMVKVDPAGKIALAPHHHGSLACHVHPGQYLVQKLRRDGGQNSETHQEFTWGTHEKWCVRSRPARRPQQDVPTHQGLRRQVGEHLRDIHCRGLPGQNTFHPGMRVVPKASALPERKQVVKAGEEFCDLAVFGVNVFVKLQPREFFRASGAFPSSISTVACRGKNHCANGWRCPPTFLKPCGQGTHHDSR